MPGMKPSDIVNLFGTQVEAAAAIGVSQSAISQWLLKGRVPYLRQHQIQVMTAGRLLAEKPSSDSIIANDADSASRISSRNV